MPPERAAKPNGDTTIIANQAHPVHALPLSPFANAEQAQLAADNRAEGLAELLREAEHLFRGVPECRPAAEWCARVARDHHAVRRLSAALDKLAPLALQHFAGDFAPLIAVAMPSHPVAPAIESEAA